MVMGGAMIVIAMAVMMIIMAVMMIMMMILIFQEIRLDRQNAIEVEGIAAEDFGDVYLCALGAMDTRVRIQSADARFQLAQFVWRHQIGFVE
jgi:hypothetical protein